MARRALALALAAASIAALVLGGAALLLRPSQPPPSLAEAERLSAAHSTGAALGIAAELLLQHPDDAEVLSLLDRLYAGLCDAATAEPDARRAGKAPWRISFALQNALRDKPGQAAQYQVLGEYALLAGLDGAAVDALRQAGALGIAPERTRLALALALLHADRLQDLLTAIDPAAVATERPLLWNLRARAELGLGHYAAARADFQAALAKAPDNADALSRLGQLELWHGERAAAAALLTQAETVAPEAPPTLRLQGEYAYASGDYHASAAAYGALVQAHAAEVFDPIPPSLGKARALIYLGDLTAAAAALDASPLGALDASVIYYRALLAYRAGTFGRAAELAEGLDTGLPDYPPLDLLIGGAMLANGFPETATQRLRRYVTAVPGNSAAASLLHQAERRLTQPDAAAVPHQLLLAAFGFPLAEPARTGKL